MGHRPDETIGIPVRWAFLVSIALAPLLFGGNVPLAWGLNAGLSGTIALSLVGIYHLQTSPLPVHERWIAIPLACFAAVIGWALLQQSSLTPTSWHHEAWSEASRVTGATYAGSISVDPWLTRLAALQLATAGLVFWLGLQIGRDPTWARNIIMTITMSSCGYAAYGLLAAASRSDRLLWLEKPYFRDVATGTFVNPNHYAAYIAIGLAATASLTMHEIAKVSHGRSIARRRNWIDILASLGRKIPVYILAVLLLWAALLVSGSRAGVVLAIMGLATVMLLDIARHRDRRILSGLCAAAGLLAALFLFPHAPNRTVEDLALTKAGDLDSRLAVSQMTMNAIGDAPLTGFGLGTFSRVFPAYRDGRISLDGIWLEAHNSYLETVLGLGIPAAALLFIALGWTILRCVFGALRRRRDHTAPLAAVAATIIVGVHALFDFSVQLQGIAFTYAALLGCGTAQSWSSRLRMDTKTMCGTSGA